MNEEIAVANQVAPIDVEDAAWVSFKTPLTPEQLIEFCRDVHRLLRINPYLEFSQWQVLSENHFYLQAINSSTKEKIQLDTNIKVEQTDDGLRLIYDNGLKSTTTFKIEQDELGSTLTIIDTYDTVDENEREQRLDEVDKSLIKWAQDIQLYLVRWRRWSKYSFWRWYMNRIWLPMKPSARRITYMLLSISLVEVSLILLGAAIYTVEYL